MNCELCPHMAAIKKALKPCQACEAGQLHGQVHVDASTTDWAAKQRIDTNHTQTDGVTSLDPDTENALRVAMANLFDLEPIELLLVQHVIKGGSYASFCDVLFQLLRRLRTKEQELCGKKDGFRSLAHTWAKKVEAKMPKMRDVLRARIELT